MSTAHTVSITIFLEEISNPTTKIGGNFLKKCMSVLLALALLVGCVVCAAYAAEAKDVVPDGVYRGAFTDPKQVEVEFEIKDNTFVSF